MDPLTIILVAIKVITVAAVVALITYGVLVAWFQEREELVQEDLDNIAFTIKELLDTDDYRLVQGIFNTRTEKVVDGRKIRARNADSKVKDLHREKQLVVYQ